MPRSRPATAIFFSLLFGVPLIFGGAMCWMARDQDRTEKEHKCRDAHGNVQRAKADPTQLGGPWIVEQWRTRASDGAAICRAVGLTVEAEQLDQDVAFLARALQQFAPSAAKQTAPAAIDPSTCPTGRVVAVAATGEKITCTGRGLAEFAWSSARTYLQAEGYLVAVGTDGDNLRAEKDDELIVATYAAANDTNAPKCVAVHSRKGTLTDWRSVVASRAGVDAASVPQSVPFKGPGASLSIGKITVRLRLEGDPTTGVVGVYLDRAGCD